MTVEPQSRDAPFPLSDILGSSLPARIEVIDIGAFDEGRPRYETLVRQGICRVTGFEANPEAAESALAALPEGSRVLPYALGDGEPATLHVTQYPGCSSLFEPNAAVIDMFVSISVNDEGGNFRVMEQRPVSTRRLDDVPECPQADYLKLDVQGAELLVLQNGLTKISDAVVIETEVEFLEVYKGQPLFGDMQTFMREQGFVLHKLIEISGSNFRPLAAADRIDATSQFLWADAVFVRDFTRFDRFTPAQLIVGAVILHDIYLSYDLAHLFLYAHDFATGSGFAAPYRDRLGDIAAHPRLFGNIRAGL